MEDLKPIPEREIKGLLALKDESTKAGLDRIAPYDPLKRYLYEIKKFSPLSRRKSTISPCATATPAIAKLPIA